MNAAEAHLDSVRVRCTTRAPSCFVISVSIRAMGSCPHLFDDAARRFHLPIPGAGRHHRGRQPVGGPHGCTAPVHPRARLRARARPGRCRPGGGGRALGPVKTQELASDGYDRALAARRQAARPAWPTRTPRRQWSGRPGRCASSGPARSRSRKPCRMMRRQRSLWPVLGAGGKARSSAWPRYVGPAKNARHGKSMRWLARTRRGTGVCRDRRPVGPSARRLPLTVREPAFRNGLSTESGYGGSFRLRRGASRRRPPSARGPMRQALAQRRMVTGPDSQSLVTLSPRGEDRWTTSSCFCVVLRCARSSRMTAVRRRSATST